MPNFNFDFFKRNHADDLIDGLIEKVVAAYPPARCERIKARAEATWKTGISPDKDRISYVAFDNTAPEEPKVPDDADGLQNELILQLKLILQHAEVDDDYYPGFPSGLEQVTMPSLFGCIKESALKSNHVKPVIQSPSDVYSLPPAEVREGFVCHEMLRRMAYKHRRTNGRISVYITDMQGPFSCAAQIWGIEDFMCALYENPNEAHHLLSLCTDAIIQYYRAMYTAVGDDLIPIHCPYDLWIPKDCGVAVSDDFLAINSANIVREFSLPYMDKIGEVFGGVITHSCGAVDHVVKALNEMKTLKGINFGSSETNLPAFVREYNPDMTLIVHQTGGIACNGLPLLSGEEHFKLCKDVYKATGAKLIAIYNYDGKNPDASLWQQAVRL